MISYFTIEEEWAMRKCVAFSWIHNRKVQLGPWYDCSQVDFADYLYWHGALYVGMKNA